METFFGMTVHLAKERATNFFLVYEDVQISENWLAQSPEALW